VSQGTGIYRPSPSNGPILQGEILSGIQQPILTISENSADTQEFEVKDHPWVIVMSQDCDLDQDYRKEVGSSLPNILLSEVSIAEVANQLIRNQGTSGAQRWDRIRKNNEPRYHFLEKPRPDDDADRAVLEEFVIDFKRYFTLPSKELYAQLEKQVKRRSVLNSPYLEHLAHRFHSYHSRVALDTDHMSE
jgi:hypothetical protein